MALRRFAVALLPPTLPLTVSQRNVNLFVNIPFTPLSIEKLPLSRGTILCQAPSEHTAHYTVFGIYCAQCTRTLHTAHYTLQTVLNTLHTTQHGPFLH